MGVIIGLMLVIAALGLFLLTNRDDKSSDDPTTAVAPTTQTIAPSTPASPATPSASQPSIEQVTVTAQATTTVTQQAPAPAPPPPAAPPPAPPAPAWPPAGTTECDPYVYVNGVTSCSFAYEVAVTYYEFGPGNYDVYSPVTGNYHNMTCSAQTANVVYCSGGSNAEVWFRQ